MRGRLRRAAVVLLLVLGCGLTGAALISMWTRATVLNTDRYVKTMAPIGESAAVQKAVADKLEARITGAIDFNALAREVLPDRADVLAPAIAAGGRVGDPRGARPLRRVRPLPDAVGGGQPARALAGRGAAHHRGVGTAHARGRHRLPRLQRRRRAAEGAPARPRLQPRRRRDPGERRRPHPAAHLDRLQQRAQRHQPAEGPDDRAAAARAAVLRRPHPHVDAAAARLAARRARPRGDRPAAARRGRDRALGLPRRDRPGRAPAPGGVGHLRRAARPPADLAADRGRRGGRARAAQPARRQAGAGRGGRHGAAAASGGGARRAPTRAPHGWRSTRPRPSGAWCCWAGWCSSPGTTRPRAWS